MEKESKKVTLRLITEELGTVPKNPDIFTEHMTAKITESNNPDEITDTEITKKIEEETATVPVDEESIGEKGWTGFHMDEHGIFIYSHMIKGYLKASIETCMENGAIPKIVAYKKWVDRLIFPAERKIYFDNGSGKNLKKPDGYIERSLRAMTAKGERVALIKSDYVGIGRTLTFTLHVLKNKKGLDWKILEIVFGYGQFYGLGQWRGSGGYGQFAVEKVEDV